MKQEMFNYLKSFMNGIECFDGNTAEQARAMFTTICFVGNIDADTAECDRLLHILCDESDIEDIIDYDDFESYMITLIV